VSHPKKRIQTDDEIFEIFTEVKIEFVIFVVVVPCSVVIGY